MLQKSEFWVILAGATPIVEVKGAIPMGIAMGYSAFESFLLSLVGNLAIVPILLLFLRPVFKILKKNEWIKNILEKIEQRTLRKNQKYLKYSLFGLFLVVAIPLPGTGVYTGCLAASLLDIRYKYSFPIVLLGAVVSAACIYTLSGFGVGFH